MDTLLPFEALTAAVGDSLNELIGSVSTRLVQPLQGEVVLQSGAGLLNASSAAGAVVTFSSGVLVAIPAGSYFRVLSNLSGLTTRTAAISSRDSDTQLTLSGAGVGAAFSGESWEIYTPAETTATVETTYGFPGTNGRLYIDGVLFAYTGSTATTFTGLSHDDGTGVFVSGAPADKTFLPTTEVVDYSKKTAALDLYRRSFFLRTAVGEDLDAIGINLGLPRPEALSDDTYRAVLMAIAYSPRGTEYAIEQLLTALVGAGNYEVFTDLTGGRNTISGSPDGVNHHNEVFVRVDRSLSDSAFGKSFVHGPLYLPATNSSLNSVSLPASYSRHANTRALRVRLPSDPYPGGIQVASGTQATGTAGATEIVVTGPTGEFPTRILRGDIFCPTQVTPKKEWYVEQRVSATELRLRPLLSGEVFHDAFEPLASFPAGPWKVYRDRSKVQNHLPSAEQEETYPASGAYVASWEFVGSGTEGTDVALAAGTAIGDALSCTPTTGDTAYYRHRARIDPSSRWSVTAKVYVASWSAFSTTNHGRWGIMVDDGNLRYFAGLAQQTGTTGTFRLANASTGAAIGTPAATTGTLAQSTVHELRFERVPSVVFPDDPAKATLRLFVDHVLVQEVPYSSMGSPPSSVPGSVPPGVSFGALVAHTSTPTILVRDVWWQIDTPTDFLYIPRVGGADVGPTAGGTRTIDVSPNTDIVVGRHIHIRPGTPNAGGGLAEGTWVVDTAASTSVGTLIGPTRYGAETGLAGSDIIDLGADPNGVRFPHMLGQQLELLDGPDVGVYDISAILAADGTNLSTVSGEATNTSTLFVPTANAARTYYEGRGTLVQVSNPPSGGFSRGENLRWRIVPIFASNTALDYVVGPAGSYSAPTLTFARALSLNYSAGTYVPHVAVTYGPVPSAQVWHPKLVNMLASASPLEGTHWPFYLFDELGLPGRQLLDLLTAAGVRGDSQRLTRDSAGLHVL